MDDKINQLKMMVRESQVEFFTDEELKFYLDANDGFLDSLLPLYLPFTNCWYDC